MKIKSKLLELLALLGGLTKKTKITLLSLLLVVVLAVFGTIAICCGHNDQGDEPDQPTVDTNEYLEAGVYASWNTDSKCVLVLQKGGKFTIAYKDLNDCGSYTLAGSALALNLDGKGNVDASYAQTAITLVYGGDSLTLYKMIDYTVTFATNGGNAVESQIVTNGSTAAAPADPTRLGYAFLGWYADAAFTTKYDFATAVTSDVTVYAKWTEKTEGQIEYTVDFVGADIEDAQTIGGKLVELPTPTKEGYTFGGWWLSMYDDADKLTCEYTAGTVLAADTTLYAVWHDDSATTLKAPAVSVSANKISWTAIAGAKSYKLTVTAPDGTVLVDNKTVVATTEAIDFASMNPGEYIVSVVAVAGSSDENSPAAVRYYTNKALDRVSTFHVENGILIFGAVQNAEKYTLSIDCGNENHNHTAVDNGLSTTYYLANCTMQPGGILITVTASAAGYAPSTSKTFSYEKNLNAITSITNNAETDSITWAPVIGATNYKVTVTVGENTYTYDNGTLTTFSTASFSGEFTVSVVPEADGCNSPAASTVEVVKTAPAAPTNIQTSGMTITWDAVEGAASYMVNIGGQTATVTTNTLDLTTLATPLTQGKTYTIKVMAFNENGDASSYSEAISIGYNVFESTLNYNKGTVSWSPVLTEDGHYEVRVNEGSIKTVLNGYSSSVTFNKDGVNLIEVRFVSDAYTSEWMQLEVTAYTVEFDTRSTQGIISPVYVAYGDVIKLPTPKEYTGFDFSGWYGAPKGNGKAYTTGSTFTGSSYTVLYANWTPHKYTITFDLSGLDITNLKTGDTALAGYTENYTLPIPVHADEGVYMFVGWYTAPYGQGEQLTDKHGVSVAKYSHTMNLTAYPYYTSDSLTFELQPDGTYGVKAGPEIGSITDLKIPATFNGIKISRILEKGFLNCSYLKTVKIPDSIQLVGLKAFNGTTNLKSIETYVAFPGETYDNTFYSTSGGALIRNDMGTIYLEVVPQGMTGTYVIPEGVQNILENAFRYTKISAVEIAASVVSIPRDAFYMCSQLKTVTFVGGRTSAVTIGEEAFFRCEAVESIVLPANIGLELNALAVHLDAFPALKSIEIEDGSDLYSSIGGMLTNKAKTAIIYCPKAYVGSYTIPDGITTIGKNAFNGRSNITEITIPTWVTTIEEGAFANCGGVREITFEGGRTDDLSIGKLAFAYHRTLASINFACDDDRTLDTGKITIGEYAFAGNSSSTYRALTNIYFNEGTNIVSIGNYAFANNSKLLNINLQSDISIKTIGDYAFAGCSMLTNLTVPATVTSIGQYAFQNNVSLVNVLFDPATDPNAALTIADYAFQGCEKLGTITLPDHLDTFRSSAFDGCELLKQINVTDTNPNYLSDANGILYKKNTDADGNPIMTELLFYPKGLAKELGGNVNNLPDTLVIIGGAAFSNNIYLTNVVIPASVTVIEDSAFANCAHLRTLTFVAGGTTLEIGNNAFENCSELSDDFALPAYTTKIGNFAFKNCDFTKFTIPAQVASIGSGAFAGCDLLETVVFNTTVELQIGLDGTATAALGAFSGCKSLKSLQLPAKLTTIGAYSFYGCTSLATVEFGTTTLTDGVYTVDSELKTIGDYAFAGCTALQSAVLSNTVTYVGLSAFEMPADKTNALTEVSFELGGTEDLLVANYAFRNATKLEKVNFPARVSLMTYGSNSDKTTADESEYTYGVVDSNLQLTKYSNSTTSGYTNSRLPYLTRNIFEGCTSLAEINVLGETYEGQKFSSLDGVLYNADKTILVYCPSANVGKYVDGVATKEIKIPTSVTLVASFAFYNCTELNTITFEEFDTTDERYGTQLLTIGNSTTIKWQGAEIAAIGGTYSAIKTINLPSHLSTVNGYAFGSKGKTAVNLNINPAANSLTLANYAFERCRASSIHISSIKAIGTYAFANCGLLESLTIDSFGSLTEIPANFLYMDGEINNVLTSFVIPEQITSIAANAFYNCRALENINIHSGITKIGSYAFFELALKSVTIPVGVTNTTLGTSAFGYNKQLTTVIFATDENGKSPITQIPSSLFQQCTALANINLDVLDLVTIKSYAFEGCNSLANVDFTKFTNLTTIESNAFNGVPLIVVDLSNTKVTTLTNAFNGARKMTTLILPNGLKTVSAGAITSAVSLETLQIGTATTGAQLLNLRTKDLKTLIIPEGHPTLIKENGIVYDTAKQTIFFADRGADLTNYVMPSTVTTISNYAFYGAHLGDLVISENVTKIGTYAFQLATINSVTIPAKVATIDNYAFYKSTLKSVTFVDTATTSKLTKINQYAFAYTNLESVIIPDSVTTLGANVFQNCTSLKAITFGSKHTSVKAGVILGCTNLESITFQSGVKTINAIFQTISAAGGSYSTNKVTSITIPSSVTSIAASAFAGFAELETVNFQGNSVTSIGNFAFYGCESLKSFTVPGKVTSIGTYAFYGCTALETFDMSQSGVSTISQGAFANTTALTNFVFNQKVATIGAQAFANTGLTSVTFPATVTTLNSGAFENATKLQTVVFPETSKIKNIGTETATGVFAGTTALESVVIPNGVNTIGVSAFENSGIKSVTVTDPDRRPDIRTVGKNAFAYCTNLTEFNLLESATTIGDYAFMGCTALTKAELHEGLTTLGIMAFGFCENLESAYIPSTAINISGNPFAGIDATKLSMGAGNDLYSLVSENGVTILYDIDQNTIYGVYGAEGEFVIGDDIFAAAPGAFAGTDITSIFVPKRFGVVYDAMFMNCDKLETVTVETGITSFGEYAFYGTALKTIVIPKTVTSLAAYSISNNPEIDHIVIPASVLVLGKGVFANNTSLADVSFEYNEDWVELNSHTFYGCTSLKEVVLPYRYKANKDAVVAESGLAYTASGIDVTCTYGLLGYTFANTGIVNAYIPTVHHMYKQPIFSGCKDLVSITYGTTFTYKNNTTKPVVPEVLYEGCDKLEAIYYPVVGGVTASSTKYNPDAVDYDYALKSIGIAIQGGVKNVHVMSIDFTHYNSSSVNWTITGGEDAVIYFDNNNYEEIVEFFRYCRKTWNVTIYDKDGNRLVCDDDSGIIASVVNADGETIWTNSKSGADTHPDDEE